MAVQGEVLGIVLALWDAVLQQIDGLVQLAGLCPCLGQCAPHAQVIGRQHEAVGQQISRFSRPFGVQQNSGQRLAGGRILGILTDQ